MTQTVLAPPPVKKGPLPHEVFQEGSGQSIPDVLLQYQKNLFVEMETASVCFVEKSRRVGITWAAGAYAVLTAAANQEAGGQDVMYIGPALDMAREFIDTCASWAKAFAHAASEVQEHIFKDDDDREITVYRITFDSGFEILALTSRPRSLRGRQGIVIIDEAAFHDDLEAVMDAALAFLMWGGKVLVLSTHFGADNRFNEYIKDIKDEKLSYAHLRIDFDDALRDGFYKRVCLVRKIEWSKEGEDKYRAGIIADYGKAADQELFCIPARSGGAYISGALVESRQVDAPVVRLTCDDDFVFRSEFDRRTFIDAWCEANLQPLIEALDPDKMHVFGEDFGRNGDLTVIWLYALLAMGMKYTPFTVELRNVPFQQQKQILFYILDRLPRFVRGAMDARGNGQQLAEETMQRYGADRIERVMISPLFYLKAVPPYRAALEDGSATVPRDKLIVDDHRAVIMVNGVPAIPDTRTRDKATGEQRHADSFIAAVMAHYATTLPQMHYEYHSITQRQEERNPMRPDHSSDYGYDQAARFRPGKGAY